MYVRDLESEMWDTEKIILDPDSGSKGLKRTGSGSEPLMASKVFVW
jgi:hypothetical protein